MDLSGHEGEIPIPMTNSYLVHGHFNSRPPPTTTPTHTTISSSANNNNIEVHQQQEQQQAAAAAALLSNSNKKIVAASKAVKYRECLKNHAASMGGNATDGCGEFMQGGEEGTLEAFRCSACSCHRNFHRKLELVQAQPSPSSTRLDANYYHLNKQVARKIATTTTTTTTTTYGTGPGYNNNIPCRPAPPPALIMPLGALMHTSEYSDDCMEEGYIYGGTRGMAGDQAPAPMVLKKSRFRTKFTQEQKEKMLAFAERVGWRLQRQEEGLVQHFCQEIGVRRRVLKVWMHNNKHSSLAKKNAATLVQLHSTTDHTTTLT